MANHRNAMFDVLKGLGIISVILSHTYRGGTDPLAVFIRELAMWCVPMFFMVQGYFMSGTKNYWQSSWKKIKKTYIPYLYWAVAYGAFYWFTIGKSFSLLDILYGKTALHLYYMFYYIIFALFLSAAVSAAKNIQNRIPLLNDFQQYCHYGNSGNFQNLSRKHFKLVWSQSN